MNRLLRACLGTSHFSLRRLGALCLPALAGAMSATLPAVGQPALGGGAAPAPAGVASPAAAPLSAAPSMAIKSNATPTKAENDAVAKFVVERVALLGKDSGAARDELVNASVSGSVQNPATPAYLLNLTTTLNKEVLRVFEQTKDMRARINIAIVVAKVAVNAQNAWLQPSVEKLLAAENKDGVVLWAMKAAGAILPQPGVNVNSLLDKILTAVKTHASSGPIADEAYSALQPTILPPSKDTIRYTQDVYRARIKAYEAAIPEDPAVDRKPSVFLTVGGPQGMWTLSNAEGQKVTMQLIHDLIASAARQADAAPAGDQHEQLIYLISSTGKAIDVIGVAINDPSLAGAAKAITRLPANTPPGQVTPAVQSVLTAIRTAFKLPAPATAAVPTPVPQ